MDDFLFFLILWGAGSALYVLPFVIDSLLWWRPKLGLWYRNRNSRNLYSIAHAHSNGLQVSVKEQNEEERLYQGRLYLTWAEFRKRFNRKPVTLKTQAKGYAQSAKKLSKKRLTYRELQSHNALLDNEVKRLHAEVKVLRVNPKLRKRFGPKEVSTGIQKDALKCAKDLRKYAKDLREGVEATAPFFIRVWGDKNMLKEDGMYLIFGEEPSLIVHHKTLELLKPVPRPKMITVHLDNETERAMVGHRIHLESAAPLSPMQVASLLKSSNLT